MTEGMNWGFFPVRYIMFAYDRVRSELDAIRKQSSCEIVIPGCVSAKDKVVLRSVSSRLWCKIGDLCLQSGNVRSGALLQFSEGLEKSL